MRNTELLSEFHVADANGSADATPPRDRLVHATKLVGNIKHQACKFQHVISNIQFPCKRLFFELLNVLKLGIYDMRVFGILITKKQQCMLREWTNKHIHYVYLIYAHAQEYCKDTCNLGATWRDKHQPESYVQ